MCRPFAVFVLGGALLCAPLLGHARGSPQDASVESVLRPLDAMLADIDRIQHLSASQIAILKQIATAASSEAERQEVEMQLGAQEIVLEGLVKQRALLEEEIQAVRNGFRRPDQTPP